MFSPRKTVQPFPKSSPKCSTGGSGPLLPFTTMKKNHYYLQRVNSISHTDAGKNKRDAIRQGRELAAKEKRSISLWKYEQTPDQERPSLHYIGILEFPYYLRNCQLTAADITVNI